MESIGVGLIGTGFMGKSHAIAWNAVKPVFADVPAIRLAHLGEVNAELASLKALEFGLAKQDCVAPLADMPQRIAHGNK